MVVVEMLHKLGEKVLLFCPRIVCWGILYEAFMGLRHSWKKERKKERKDDQPNQTDLPPPSPVLPSQREPDISVGCCFLGKQL
jgi:hypothetical protein